MSNLANLSLAARLLPVNVSLKKHWRQFCKEQVSAGRYENQSEVIRAGLRALEESQERHAAELRGLETLKDGNNNKTTNEKKHSTRNHNPGPGNRERMHKRHSDETPRKAHSGKRKPDKQS